MLMVKIFKNKAIVEPDENLLKKLKESYFDLMLPNKIV